MDLEKNEGDVLFIIIVLLLINLVYVLWKKNCQLIILSFFCNS